MDPNSFRARIGSTASFATDRAALQALPGSPSGGAPAPFNALDALRMSGPPGSHPLAAIDLPQLVPGPTSRLEGGIEIEGPARVGETITGVVRVRARQRIQARGAVFRLTGIRLHEAHASAIKRSTEAVTFDHGSGSTTTKETRERVSWVEIHANEVEALTFLEPRLPATMDAGQVIALPFSIPAPRLGPPTAHAGVGAIAWAVEAHWDIGFGADDRVAAFVDVGQHPDLLRAGVLTLPNGALFDRVTDASAVIGVMPLPPIAPGTALGVTVAWPDAPEGRSARAELLLDVSGDSGIGVVVTAVAADERALGKTTVSLPIPADLPPTLDTPGLKIGYRVRVVVDRKLRSDVSRERPIVIC